MKHFLNRRDRIVCESIDGLLASAAAPGVGRLDGYPDIKVILRTDWDKRRVAVVSGGGAGHEPAHAGFVGAGMLTAAVSGEIFASPTVEAVLAAIRAVTGLAGCLLIVKNYTGDRLNFGLAAERAKAEGLDVRVLIVGDDVAIPGFRQPRGIAGTLFAHRIAGFLADAGLPLDDVERLAGAAAASAVSYGLSLTSCSIPGQPFEERIGQGEVEMGLGIHGEPGAERIPLREVSQLVAAVSDRLLERIDPNLGHAVLINNLGGVSALEMGVVANAVLASPLAKSVELVCGPAPLMTSLDMKGFSLSLLPLDGVRRSALTAQCGAPAWPAARPLAPVRPVAMPAAAAIQEERPSEGPRAQALIRAVCERLIEMEPELNRLDSRTGDGDTGTTIAAGARAILSDLGQLPLASFGNLGLSIGRRVSRAMGGSSGVLMSIFFTAAGEAYQERSDAGVALIAGLERLKFYGGAALGDRTLIDALEPALQAYAGDGLDAAAVAARKGADRTALMPRASAGRSSYVNESSLAGIPDPGAVAVAAAFAAAVSALGTVDESGTSREGRAAV